LPPEGPHSLNLFRIAIAICGFFIIDSFFACMCYILENETIMKVIMKTSQLISHKIFTSRKSQQAILTGLMFAIGLSGCSLPPTSNPASPIPNSTSALESKDKKDQKVILTTFTVLADMAQNVAGDKAIVESITKAGAEIHGYEPTPSDLRRGQSADLILDNGLSAFITAFLKSIA
jgi:hypothetical protein